MSYNTVDFVFTESQERKAILDFISSIGVKIDDEKDGNNITIDDIKNASLEDLKLLAIKILSIPAIDKSQMSIDDYMGYKQMSIYDENIEIRDLGVQTQKFHPHPRTFTNKRKNK